MPLIWIEDDEHDEMLVDDQGSPREKVVIHMPDGADWTFVRVDDDEVVEL